MNMQTNEANHESPEIDFALFGNYPIQFRQYLSERDYAEGTIRQYLSCIGSLAEMMKADGITVGDLDETQAVALIAKTGWKGNRMIYATFIVRCFVRFLIDQGVGKPALPPTAKEIAREELRRDYETYLRHQRGLSERTIFQSWRFADRFLEFRFGEEVGDLTQITTANIASFLQQLTTRRPPLRDKTSSSHLRNFFRYLFQSGKTTANLALGILSVAQRYGTRLPRHLTTEQVDILVRAVRTDSYPTYTAPSGSSQFCGAPIPPGGFCTCNCVCTCVPVCQAHRLHHSDPIVRTMAEELLYIMGRYKFEYMYWAADNAKPGLQRRILEVMTYIVQGAKPNPRRWPSVDECIQRLTHTDEIVAIMAAQMLDQHIARGLQVDPSILVKVRCLLNEAARRPWFVRYNV